MTTVEAIRELMSAWDALVANVRRAFPTATDEDVYRIASQAMNRSLGLEVNRGG